jgi:carboxyl-terminal processing protease
MEPQSGRARFGRASFTARILVAGTAFYCFSAFAAPVIEPDAAEVQSEEVRALIEAFGRIKAAYVDPLDEKKLVSQAIKGMLSGLDPHSVYLDAQALGDWRSDLDGQFVGLGIDIDMVDGYVKVISPIEDTPAERAGIKAGDLIVKLGDEEVKGMTLRDAVARMRGPSNTDLTLTILRADDPTPRTIVVTRNVIRVRSVKPKLIEPGYGYVRLTRFQDSTAEQMINALESLYKQNGEPLRGLILDMRDNPGGLVSAAVGVAAAFLPPNAPIVDLDGRSENYSSHLSASAEYYLRRGRDDYMKRLPAAAKTVPMVVLVNGGSASASEIVAGALQDHKRAIIAGTQTFGKGSVQTTLSLSNNTAIRLTTARYYTPSGRSIQAKGILPDMTLEDPLRDTAAPRTREADLERHLRNPDDKDNPAQQVVKTSAQSTQKAEPGARSDEKGEKPRRREYGTKDDVQLRRAVDFMKGQQTASR